MGICLSCHRRQRRVPEKHTKLHHPSCQSVLPLHVCNGECDKLQVDQIPFDISRNNSEKKLLQKGSLLGPRGASGDWRNYTTEGFRPAPGDAPLLHQRHVAEAALPDYSPNATEPRLFALNGCATKNECISFLPLQSDPSLQCSDSRLRNFNSVCDSKETDLIEFKVGSREDVSAIMANAISNMKMTNPIKNLVSKRRKRYTKDGFNLDLAYITDNVIAMGFPAEKLEGVYRNHIDDVVKLLEQKHKDHYKIYNLCSERSYDPCKFHNRVATYAFDDHNPPKIELIKPFCEDVHKWLTEDSQNVAAVHCKAGKGRTGTMICCYMLHSEQCSTAMDALNFYGQKRAHDRKGVTIPSQRRYVEYYGALINMMRKNGNVERPENRPYYRPSSVLIRELKMEPLPSLNGGQCTLEFCVSDANMKMRKVSSGVHEVKRDALCARLKMDTCTPLAGDIKVEVYCKPKMIMRKEKLFHFWFNTFFVTHEINAVKDDSLDYDRTSLATYKLTLDKWQLDDAHKDKQNKLYCADFKAELIVQKVPLSSAWSERPLEAASAGTADRPSHHRPPQPHTTPSTSDESSDDSQEDEERVQTPVLTHRPLERLKARSLAHTDFSLSLTLQPLHYLTSQAPCRGPDMSEDTQSTRARKHSESTHL